MMRRVGWNDNGLGGQKRKISEFNQEQHCGLNRPLRIFTGSTRDTCKSAANVCRHALDMTYHYYYD